MKASEIAELLPHMTAEERAELNKLLAADKALWRPQPGAQSLAYHSTADILGYGGAAGGGKTDLLIGKALTQHRRAIIFRREGTQLQGIYDRLAELLGGREGFNSQDRIWRPPSLPQLQIEFGSVPNADDTAKYQGRPHDFLCVGRGTPILMADGAHRAIEEIAAGDMVATLEGPRRVTRLWPVRRDQAVRLTVRDAAGEPVYSQVQSATHSVLTSRGWLAARDLGSPAFRGEASEGPFDYRHARRSLSRSRVRPPCPSATALAGLVLQRGCSQRLLATSLSALCASGAQVAQGSGFSASWSQPEAAAPRPSAFAPQAHRGPSLRSAGLSVQPQARGRGGAGARASTSPQGSLAGYRTSPRSDDGQPLARLRFLPSPAAGQEWSPQSADAEQPNPTGSQAGDRGRTPTRTCPTRTFDHPYGKGTRQAVADLSEASFDLAPVGEVDLFDIEVEDANHYLSGPGVPNKNCFDEATNFLEAQVRFLLGWLRTTTPGQRCQALMTFNPPTTAEGRWVVGYFAPWLDDKHPRPAENGELRWFASIKGEDVEVDGPEPIKRGAETIVPMSRTFIAARITDNPFLMSTGYMAQLQSLPEPLRSQMLHGDFMAGTEDDPWQVIPTKWVDEAMRRWEPKHAKGPMDSLGVDVARGGRDETIICPRYGTWFDELKSYPGESTPDGPSVAGLVISQRRDLSPVHIDLIGWGASAYDFLVSNGIQAIGINGSNKSLQLSKEGGLRFVNHRAELWWRMREALDPINPDPIALPPDNKLRGDLCAPRWKLAAGGIQIEAKDEVIRRIGRSPDRGDAACMALIATEKDGAEDRSDARDRRSVFGSAGWLA